jgi:OPT oligopeptide transporter protein
MNIRSLLITGLGLSTFGGTLASIYYFKPQMLSVSVLFLGIISYVLGELMSYILPRKGLLGRLFNPHSVRQLTDTILIC